MASRDEHLADLVLRLGWLTAEQLASHEASWEAAGRPFRFTHWLVEAGALTRLQTQELDATLRLDPTQSLGLAEQPTMPSGDASRRLDPSNVPDQVGRFTLSGRLGSGGMGDVFCARDTDLDRIVAMKVLARRGEPRHLVRFLEEARIAGQLEHGNIVPVHEVGILEDGRPYFTMRLVAGRTLTELLGSDALAIKEGRSAGTALVDMLQVFLKVCDAVEYAHSRSVIHGDLKPGNVMVGEYGEVQVLDWGLSHRVEADVPTPESLARRADQKVVGTPAYMSPEQAMGERLDQRSEVYSLGAILYTILTLSVPFEGPDAEHIVERVRRGELVPPSGRSDSRRVPWELEAIVLKAMALDPGSRYADVTSLKTDILTFLGGGLIGAARYTAWQRLAKLAALHRRRVAIVLFLMVGVAGAVVFSQWRSERAIKASQDRSFAAAMSEAQGLVASLPADGQGPVESYLSATSALDAALMLRQGDPDALSLRRQVGEGLTRAATRTGEYTLALHAARDLGRLGLSDARVAALEKQVIAARDDRLRKRRERLLACLEDLEAGLSREGRDPRLPSWDDYVFEAVGYRDPQTVEILARALAPMIDRARRQKGTASFTSARQDVARFCCRVLGRLGLAEVLAPLVAWAGVVREPTLAVEVGLALCNTRRPEAHPALLTLRGRVGSNSLAWRTIVKRFHLVPEPAGTDAPVTAMDWLQRGRARLERGETIAGYEDLKRAIEMKPDWDRPYFVRGTAREHAGEGQPALRDYDSALRLNPANFSARHNRGNILIRLDRVDEAIEAFGKVIAEDPRLRSKAYFNRARAYERKEDVASALDDLARAIALEPDFAEAYGNRGTLRLRRKEYAAALQDFDRATTLSPRDAVLQSNRAFALLALGRPDAAIVCATRALQLDPRWYRAYVCRADARERKGDTTGAINDYAEAIRIEPRSLEAHFRRGLLQMHTDREKALVDFDHVLELDPKLAAAHVNRSTVLRALGRLEEARLAASRATQIAPRNWIAWLVLGQALRDLRRLTEARDAMKKSLGLAPEATRPKIRTEMAGIE